MQALQFAATFNRPRQQFGINKKHNIFFFFSIMFCRPDIASGVRSAGELSRCESARLRRWNLLSSNDQRQKKNVWTSEFLHGKNAFAVFPSKPGSVGVAGCSQWATPTLRQNTEPCKRPQTGLCRGEASAGEPMLTCPYSDKAGIVDSNLKPQHSPARTWSLLECLRSNRNNIEGCRKKVGS